jgi:CheY-like chemotaxis protein
MVDNRRLQDALRAGCEDVAVLGSGDGAPLITRLEAILRYHRRYGFAPHSGHWLTFDKDSDNIDDHYPSSDEHLTMRGSQRFIAGAEGAPHLLLISNHPSYRLDGQRALAQGGYHVGFFDSGFLALRFLHKLSAHNAPDIPSDLQGKLDLVIVALEGSPESAMTLVRQFKAQPSFAAVPILLLVNNRKQLDVVTPFRNQGVYTAVGAEHQAEDLVFRIYEIFQTPREPFYAALRQRHTVQYSWRRVQEDGEGGWHPALTYNMNRYGVYVQTISPRCATSPSR